MRQLLDNAQTSDSLMSDGNRTNLRRALSAVIENNEYIKYSSWKWHEAGLPVLRTRYIELVEYERGIFIPIAFIIAAITLIWIFRQIKMLIIALTSILVSIIWVSGIMSLMGISNYTMKL